MVAEQAWRLGVMEAALRGKITNGEGAQALGLSARQLRRLKRRACERPVQCSRRLGPTMAATPLGCPGPHLL